MEFLFLGILVCVVGAIPFGLVNLSVAKYSLNGQNKATMQIAHGASLIELVYALVALWLGEKLMPFFEANTWFQYLIILFLVATGVIFLFNQKKDEIESESRKSHFLQGAFLNLISIQVFLYWILAISFLFSNFRVPESLLQALLFLAGVWLGKMGTLKLYAVFSKRIAQRSAFIATNINRIIASVLFLAAIFQYYKLY